MKGFWKIFPVVLTTLILCFKEWETFQHINTVFFGNYHDALKNYYTVLYHVKWDAGYFHFEGMNFPYGEHVLFTDNQPLLSNALKFIQRNFFDVTPYVLGILNGLLFLSFLLAAWFNNLALRQLGVREWYAALVAVGLVFLAPQFNRINGHFGLSYSFIIPMFLYLGIRHFSNPKWSRSIFMGVATFAVGLLHAYNLGFTLLITAVIFLVEIIRKTHHVRISLAHFGLQFILPLLAMQLFMFFTDSIPDRPSYPWSPFMGSFQPEGLFVSYNNPLTLWLHHKLHLRFINWEAEAYLGMSTLLIFAAIIFLSISYFKKRWQNFGLAIILQDRQKTFLLFSGISAILLFLSYSILSGNTEIYQLMGPLRQFRAVGRFQWVTYFAFNFLAFAWISSVFKSKKKVWQVSILVLTLALLTFDAYEIYNEPYHTDHKVPLLTENSAEQENMRHLLQGFDVIVPLPYFHIGSEDFLLHTEDSRYYKDAMAVSYASGLPLTSINLSRTSLSQTLAQLTYSVWPLENPPLKENLKTRNALLLVQKESELTGNEQLLITAGGGDTLFENREFYLQTLDIGKYIQQHDAKDSIYNYLKFGPKQTYSLMNYESNGEQSFVGSGSKKLAKTGKPVIESIEVPEGAVMAKVGLWIYLNQPTKAFDKIGATIKNDSVASHPHPIRIGNHLKALDDNWGYVEIEIDLAGGAKRIDVFSDPNGLHPTTTYVDMLRVSYLDGEGVFLKKPIHEIN